MRIETYKTLTLGFIIGVVFMAGVACVPAAKSALDVMAPTAIDIITQLVKDRWGADAEVDVPSTACIPGPPSSADWFGDDDDDEFEYGLCKGKAIGDP